MAAQVAVRSAKAKVLPPPSPFGELLRRSRFASFDPDIRQAYSAPPSYIHRGNWGLKRPLANRKRHGYIVLRQFEEHAQYIEWDNASEQVRLLKRIEELNMTPKLVPNTPWFVGLGPVAASTDSGMDSEFGSGSSWSPAAEEEAKVSLALDSPPPQGKGAYGANAAPRDAAGAMQNTFLSPNILAMPPPLFRQFIEKLRKMRPEFLAYVRHEMKQRWLKDQRHLNPDAVSDEELVLGLAGKTKNTYHLRFLGHKSEQEYESKPDAEAQDVPVNPNAPQPIRPQPHKFAGMMYAEPTLIETHFSVKPEPGFVLQSNSGSSQRYESKNGYIAAFAGLSAQLTDPGVGAAPLFDTAKGIDPTSTKASERKMRMVGLHLDRPPKVVGQHASSYPLRTTHIRSEVVVDSAVDNNWRQNPHRPGSIAYNSAMPNAAMIPPPYSMATSRYGTGGRLYDNNVPSTPTGRFPPRNREGTLDILSKMARMRVSKPARKASPSSSDSTWVMRSTSKPKDEGESEGESKNS